MTETKATYITDADRYQTEADFQQAIIELAEATCWLWYHHPDSRKAPAGFPDLVLVHGERKRIILAELKTEKGRLREDQRTWLDTLTGAAKGAPDCVEVHLWRPSDWPTIERILKGERNG